jgi:hypothetical protein
MKTAVLSGSERASVMLRGGDLDLLAVVQVRHGENVHVVSDAGGSKKLGGTLTRLPNTKETDKQVVGKARVEHLADQEDVGGQGGL